MPKHNNNPMNLLSARLSKDQRVFKQLTNKNALIDALMSLYNNAIKCQLENNDQDNINKFIRLCEYM
jgi:hypothetical protein